MNFEIIYSDKADLDLSELYEYIAYELLEPDTTGEQVARIVQKIASFAIFPMRYPRYSKENSWDWRFFPVDNYLVLYAVHEEEGAVEIMRVLYKARDIRGYLS